MQCTPVVPGTLHVFAFSTSRRISLFCRIILVANHLPIKATRSKDDRSWDFEWDDDALIAQAHVRSVPSTSLILHAYTHKNALAAAVFLLESGYTAAGGSHRVTC